MMPHKFQSNFPEILESIPEANINPKTILKILGVLWDSSHDKIMFDIQLPENEKKVDTKRSFLETSATIFDPLGLLSPFVMRIKLLFQQFWLSETKDSLKSKKSWDTQLLSVIQ